MSAQDTIPDTDEQSSPSRYHAMSAQDTIRDTPCLSRTAALQPGFSECADFADV